MQKQRQQHQGNSNQLSLRICQRLINAKTDALADYINARQEIHKRMLHLTRSMKAGKQPTGVETLKLAQDEEEKVGVFY